MCRDAWRCAAVRTSSVPSSSFAMWRYVALLRDGTRLQAPCVPYVSITPLTEPSHAGRGTRTRPETGDPRGRAGQHSGCSAGSWQAAMAPTMHTVALMPLACSAVSTKSPVYAERTRDGTTECRVALAAEGALRVCALGPQRCPLSPPVKRSTPSPAQTTLRPLVALEGPTDEHCSGHTHTGERPHMHGIMHFCTS